MIRNSTMDGRFYRQLIETEEDHEVEGLVIHPTHGLLFWYDYSFFSRTREVYPYRIMMANMDGSKIQPLVRSKSRLSNMFAIDHVNHDIYYEAEDNRIRRVNIDSKKTAIVASNSHFFSRTMAYHKGFLYWTSFGNLRVLEVAKNGARVHNVLNHDSSQTNSLRMVVNDSLHQLKPSAGNPCAELDCSWICVIVPDFTAKCLCPDGYTPSVLGTTCIPPLKETKEHVGTELMSEYCKTGVGCLNGGSCREVSNKTRIVCDCVQPYDGLYCERRKPMMSDEAVQMIIPVVLLLLLLVLIGCGVYWCFFSHRKNKTDTVIDTLPSYGRFETNESTL